MIEYATVETNNRNVYEGVKFPWDGGVYDTHPRMLPRVVKGDQNEWAPQGDIVCGGSS